MAKFFFPKDRNDAKRLSKMASDGKRKRVRQGVYTDVDWEATPRLLYAKYASQQPNKCHLTVTALIPLSYSLNIWVVVSSLQNLINTGHRVGVTCLFTKAIFRIILKAPSLRLKKLRILYSAKKSSITVIRTAMMCWPCMNLCRIIKRCLLCRVVRMNCLIKVCRLLVGSLFNASVIFL
jgi:hypothetical protein